MGEKKVPDKQIQVSESLDARGLFCPIPIVRLKAALDRIQAGEVVEIRADDPAFPGDLEAWCRDMGHRILAMQKEAPSSFHAFVEKVA